MNSQVDVETLSQITKSTTELVIVNCTSNDWPALFKEIASKAQITSLHLERCAVQDKDVAPAIELFGELITLNLCTAWFIRSLQFSHKRDSITHCEVPAQTPEAHSCWK